MEKEVGFTVPQPSTSMFCIDHFLAQFLGIAFKWIVIYSTPRFCGHELCIDPALKDYVSVQPWNCTLSKVYGPHD